MKYSNQQIHDMFIEKFNFLITKYNFSIISDDSPAPRLNNWGFELIFKGEKTAVTILFEFREAYIHVSLHRLVDGKMKHDPNPLKEEEPFLNMGLDWIVEHKDPSKLTRPLYDDTSDYYGKEDAFEIMVSRLADNLQFFAADILKGDFSLFAELDPIIKDYYKKKGIIK